MEDEYNLNDEAIKNGYIGELQDVKIYKPGEPLFLSEETKKEIVSKYMSNLGRLSHQKHPRSKEFYSSMGKMGKRKPRVV